MKKLLLLLATTNVNAESLVGFEWEPNPPIEMISTYTIYKDNVSVGTTKETKITVPCVPGSYTITASNLISESPHSEPVIVDVCVEPSAPNGFKRVIQIGFN